MDKITHQVRAEHWAKIMNECINSGMSKTAWCRANGISVKQFFYWQRILRREALPLMDNKNTNSREGFLNTLREVGDLACKPCNGTQSEGFFKLSYINGSFSINDISFLGILTNVLNDTEHEFQYCFYPVTYSRPVTQCILAGMSDDSSLIRIKVSKHTMFTPRSFFIILSHEVSHYVNRKCRQRRLRAILFVEMVTITLVNMLTQDLIEDNNSDGEYFLNRYIQTVQQRLSSYIRSELQNNLQKKKDNSKDAENIYQFSTLWEIQKEMCAKLLYDSSGKLENAIDYLGKDIVNKTQEG